MANNHTQKGFSIVSPKGQAEWCKPYEPDTKFNAAGDLTSTLLLDPELETTKVFIAKLEDLRDRALAEVKGNLGAKGNQWGVNEVYSEHYDKDGNPTGLIALKFKLKDISKRKADGKQHTIIVKDNNLRDISNEPVLIGNGSIIRCGAFAFAYEMASTKKVGISLQWQKLQIIDLVEVMGGDDFDVEEGSVNIPAPQQEIEDAIDF